MKKATYLLIVVLATLFNSCDTNDDGFYNNVYLNASNLVTFSAQSNYLSGQYFYVEATVPRYLPETGQSNLLDIYQTTNGAQKLSFSYVIERRISPTEWEIVNVPDSSLNIVNGTAQNGAYVYGICLYNQTTEQYEYKVGFPLTATGNYRASFGYNSSSTDIVELRSINQPKDLILNINSTLSNIDNSGYFYFNVN